MRRARQLFIALSIVTASAVMSSAPAWGYLGYDVYFRAQGSGGSWRCAESGIYGNRDSPSSPGVGGAITAIGDSHALKEYACNLSNSVPSGSLKVHTVIQQYQYIAGTGGYGWVTVDDDYGTVVNGSTNWSLSSGSYCSSGGNLDCAFDNRVVTSHEVNTLGAPRNNLMVTSTL